jgi:tRNA/rRNA methyltransferase
MDFYFVLVEPAVPENVGAGARAMKTMGFDLLRLVNPCEFKTGRARWVAHASTEILENAEVFDSLQEALNDMDFVIGATAKTRSVKGDHHPAASIPGMLKAKQNSVSKVAVVFGREESGLTNEELHLCDISTFVPMHTDYPSLNLSQAVMLYAYLLSGSVDDRSQRKNRNIPDAKFRVLKSKTAELLSETKIHSNPNIYNRIFERLALLGDDDINLILSVLEALKK